MKIAFLGLGAMGSRMAMNLLRAGHGLTVWNRSPEKAQPLLEAGALLAGSPREAAEGAEVVFSMVFDDAASEAVWCDPQTGALSGMDPDALGIDCSTVSPAWARTLAARAQDQGRMVIDAPVAGTLGPAEKGALIFLLGGPAEVATRARPVIEPMASEIRHVGPSGQGALTKLMVNGMMGIQQAAMAQFMAMVDAANGDRRAVFDAFCITPVASDMLRNYGQTMLEGTDQVSFPVDSIFKDFGLIDATAPKGRSSLPDAARDVFDAARKAGLGGRNQTEILRLYD